MEIWKEIEERGYLLRVSNLGRVHMPAKTTTFVSTRGGKTREQTSTFKERILAPQKYQNGYLHVALTHQRRRYRFLVHRLVALAFVLGHKPGRVVNHIDGDKLNNDPSNLEWVTPGENTLHAWKAELVDTKGEKSPRAVLTERKVRYIRKLLAQGVSIGALACIAGVSNAAILKIRDRRSWAHLATDSLFRPLR